MSDRYPDGTPQECALFNVTQLCEACEASCKESGGDPYAEARRALETWYRNGAIDSNMLEMSLALLRMRAELVTLIRAAIRKHPTLIRAAEAAGEDVEALIASEIKTAMRQAL